MKFRYIRFIFSLFALHCLASASFGQFVLNGSASQIGENCYRLTPNETYVKGSIWYEEKIDLNEDYTVYADIFLGCQNTNGADGIAFAMQPISNTIGVVGGGLGIEGVEPSLIIEFDTWENTDRNDPVYDHSAISRDGNIDHNAPQNLAGPIPTSATSNNVEDCQYHNLKITWEAAQERLTFYFDCEERLSWSGDVIGDIFDGDPNVYWGFTSATGSATNEHKLCLHHLSFNDSIPNHEVCLGEGVQLEATGGVTYSWSPPDGLNNPNISNPIASPEETTTFTVEVTDECGNEFEYETTVTVIQPLEFSLGPDTAVCEEEIVTLDPGLPPTGVYQWQDGSGTPTYTVTEEGWYWLKYTPPGECPSTDSIYVEFHEENQVSLLEIICEGDSVEFAGEYVSEDGIYLDMSENQYGCDSITELNLVVVPPPAFEIVGDSLICPSGPGNEISVDGTFNEYAWNTGATTAGITVEEEGVYSVTVTNSTGCSSTDELSVDELDIGSDTLSTQICEGESILFNGGTYSVTGVYPVSLTSEEGCDSTAVLDLSVLSSLSPVINGDSTICPQSFAILNTPSTFNSYHWNTGETTQSITVSSGGWYAVTVTGDTGCTGTDSIYVTSVPMESDTLIREICEGQSIEFGGMLLAQSGMYHDTLTSKEGCDSIVVLDLIVQTSPEAQISGETEICPSATTTLRTSSTYITYNWSTGETSRAISVDSAGWYSVTVSDDMGCTGTASIMVSQIQEYRDTLDRQICQGSSFVFGGDTIDQNGQYTDTLLSQQGCDSILVLNLLLSQSLDVQITGQSSICPSSSTMLHAPAGFEGYTWNTGDSSHSISVNAPAWYAVTVTDEFGCHGMDSIYLSLIEVPIDTTFLQICGGQSVTFGNQSLDDSGTYRDTLISQAGCDSISILELTVAPLPNAIIEGDSVLCTSSSGTLRALPEGMSYTWNTGEESPSISIDGKGWFSVTVTDPSGCSAGDSIYVDELDLLRDTIGEQICEGEEFIFGNESLSQEGTYSDTLTSQSGCDSITVLNLEIRFPPQVEIEGDSTVCENVTRSLSASHGFSYYDWNTGDSGREISITAPGLYTLTATDSYGCVTTDQFTVEQTELHPEISSWDPLCPGEKNGMIQVDGIGGGASPYQITVNGMSGDLDHVFEGLADGSYPLHITDASGCTFDTVIVLNEAATWGLNLGEDREVTYGTAVDIFATTSLDSIVNFQWSALDTIIESGPTRLTFRPFANQWVSLILEDRNGCTHTDSIFVRVKREQSVYFPNAFSPNKDGINDLWKPYWPSGKMDRLQITIFNRWGDAVYDCNGVDCIWDGTFNDKPLKPAVFIYQVEYKLKGSEESILQTGSITLIK